MELVLYFSYVRNPLTGVIYRVLKGSGMGQRHSGAVSDLCFHLLFETKLYDEAFKEEHGIECYLRYRDDIFAVFKTPFFVRPFISKMNRFIKEAYVVEIEKTSMLEVPMLDLMLRKVETHNGLFKISHSHYVKPTSRHLPLHPSSCHPMKIHRSWPISEVARIYGNSTCLQKFDVARKNLISKFQWHFFHKHVIKSCEQWCPKTFMNFNTRRLDDISILNMRPARMIIPFHWGLRNLQNVLDERLSAFKSLAPWLAQIKIVFSRSGSNVLNILKNNSMRVGGMERR